MRFDPEFGWFLAFSLAIHRRDEVAVQQFTTEVANRVTLEFEENDFVEAKSTASKERQAERFNAKLTDHMKELKGLVDDDGMKWLRRQLLN